MYSQYVTDGYEIGTIYCKVNHPTFSKLRNEINTSQKIVTSAETKRLPTLSKLNMLKFCLLEIKLACVRYPKIFQYSYTLYTKRLIHLML